jgi:hypothetical protein
MPREIIHSDFMNGPRLADLVRAQRAAPPAPAAAAPAEPLHPVWQKALANAEPPGARDVVRDSVGSEEPFIYRTSDDILRRLPERARELLRRFDAAATEARDRTIALGGHVNAASDRAGRISLDVQAVLRAAKRADLQTVEDARRVAKSPGATGPEKAWAERIIAEADRLAEAQAEHADLVRRRREHAERTAPLTALRARLTEAAARLRPPVRALDLPNVPAAKAERMLADSRREIGDLRAEIERIEAALPSAHEALILAAEAVQRYGAEAGLGAAVKWTSAGISIAEPVPGLDLEDRRPLRPLALFCAIAPDITARAIAKALGSDPDAPLMADRPRLLAEARQRLREAELRERAAIAAMGDDLTLFRPDADAAITLMVEGAR